MSKKRTGFTLMELMILVAIISIVVAIATPFYLHYSKSARKSGCIRNMQKIDGAVIMAKLSGVSSPMETDIVGSTGHLRVMPTCPNNHAPYTVLDPPECPSGDATHIMPHN